MKRYKTPKAILRAAYHLLDDKRHWSQGAEALTADGAAVNATNPLAAKWCAVGAVYAVTAVDDDGPAAMVSGWLDEFTPWGIVSVNDEQGYAAMRRVYRKAAEEHGVTL